MNWFLYDNSLSHERVKAYSASHTHRNATKERGQASSSLLENRKKCPGFGKEGPDCMYLRVKFSIPNEVLDKNFQNFSLWGFFFLCFRRSVFRSAQVSQIQHPAWPSHINVFWALAYLEPEAHLKPCEALTRHTELGHKALFSHIKAYSEPCTTLAYAETWRTQDPGIFHNCIPTRTESCHIYENLWIFKTLIYLKPDKYLEPSQKFRMEFFANVVKNYNYFSIALHLRSLTVFWIYVILSINTH